MKENDHGQMLWLLNVITALIIEPIMYFKVYVFSIKGIKSYVLILFLKYVTIQQLLHSDLLSGRRLKINYSKFTF